MANHGSRTAQFKFWVLAWVELAQALVVIFTLAFVCPDWRGRLLFSKWMD